MNKIDKIQAISIAKRKISKLLQDLDVPQSLQGNSEQKFVKINNSELEISTIEKLLLFGSLAEVLLLYFLRRNPAIRRYFVILDRIADSIFRLASQILDLSGTNVGTIDGQKLMSLISDAYEVFQFIKNQNQMFTMGYGNVLIMLQRIFSIFRSWQRLDIYSYKPMQSKL